jgi:hypothetical protein
VWMFQPLSDARAQSRGGLVTDAAGGRYALVLGRSRMRLLGRLKRKKTP